MQSALAHYKKQGGGRVYMLKEDDKILSWALRFGKDDVYFYTRKTHRRKHYASRLMKRILRDTKPVVFPHDQASTEFFKKFKQEVDGFPE